MRCRNPTFDLTALVRLSRDSVVRRWWSVDEWVGMIAERGQESVPFGDFGVACFEVPDGAPGPLFEIERVSWTQLFVPLVIGLVLARAAPRICKEPVTYHLLAAAATVLFSVCVVPLALGGKVRAEIPRLGVLSAAHVVGSFFVSQSERLAREYAPYVVAYLVASFGAGFSVARGYIVEVDPSAARATSTALTLFSAAAASAFVPSPRVRVAIFVLVLFVAGRGGGGEVSRKRERRRSRGRSRSR